MPSRITRGHDLSTTVRVTVGGVKIAQTLAAGRRSIGLTKALRKAKRLPLGRAAVRITATDPAGNRSAPRTVKLRIVACPFPPQPPSGRTTGCTRNRMLPSCLRPSARLSS